MNIIIKYTNTLIETLKENKKLIAICFLLYFLIIIVSYIISYNTIITHATEFHTHIAPYMSNSTANHINALSLFQKNGLSVVYNYIGGIIFGIIPLFSIIYNAIALGSQIATFGFLDPNGSLRYIIYLIPHGIFEIPGSILGSASGLILFRFIWRLLKDLKQNDVNGLKEKISLSYQNNKNILIQSLILLSFSIILMLIAAPIESNISSSFSRFILHY